MTTAHEPFAAIGRPLRRKEDRRLLTGHGQFSDDVKLPDQAYTVATPLTVWRAIREAPEAT